MNDDDIKIPPALLPQEILDTKGQQHLNEYATFPVCQNVSDINLIHTQPESFLNEWSDESKVLDAFNTLNPSDQDAFTKTLYDADLLDSIFLDELIDMNVDKLNNVSTSHDLETTTSSSQTMIQSPPNDFSCSTSFQSSPASSSLSMIQSPPNDFSGSTSFTVAPPALSSQPMIQSPLNNFSPFQSSAASSSQSMIQSPPNDFSCSTSIESSPASSTQSMIQSPPSYNFETSLQQHDYDNSVAILDISIQPENTFRFRYKSETKDPHGYLRGACSVGNNLRKHTTVDVRLPIVNQDNNVDEKFFVRCTLHQAASATSSALIHAPLSPHQLLRRIDGKLCDETELFALRKVAQNFYSFELTNVLIILTPIDQCQNYCLTKLEKLSQQNLVIGSNLVLNVAGEDLAAANPGTKKRNKQTLKPIQVQIGFEAFRCINGAYTSIAGPKFSNIITHGEPLNIAKLCNVYVSKDKGEEVTLLVSTLKTLDIKIHLQECGNTVNPWKECIEVNKKMVHQKSAISFQMPRYSGNQQDLSKIECTIQLERLCDRARSNIRSIFYANGLKRCRPSGDATIRTIDVRKPRLEDNQEVTRNVLRLKPDAVLFTDTTNLSIDSKANISYQRTVRGRQSLEHSVERNIEQINIASQNTGKANKELIAFLSDIQNWYNESKNTAIGRRKEYARHIRDYFLAYEREHPEGNSILHDILADADLKEYEIELYKITEHFELEDIVSQSTNIYGETALMLACMFKRPLLMSALINMGTAIEAQAIDNGNNVLHIAMQQQSLECNMRLMQALKMNKNPASFIKALGSRNFQGLTPLHLAVLQNNVSIVAELLQFCKRQKSFDVCQLGQLSDGNTILHLAVLNRFEDMRACILEHSGDSFSNIINYADQTAEEMMLDMDEDDMEENDELDTLVDALGGIQLQKATSEYNE